MNIVRPGNITPQGVVDPVLQCVGLQKIKRNITCRLCTAGGAPGVIGIRSGDEFCTCLTVTLEQPDFALQTVTATAPPEFISVIRHPIFTAGVHRHRHQTHALSGLAFDRPGFLQHIRAQQFPVFRVACRIDVKTFSVGVGTQGLKDVVAVHYPPLTLCAVTHDLNNKAAVASALHINRGHKKLNTGRHPAFFHRLGALLQRFTLTLVKTGSRKVRKPPVGIDNRLECFFTARNLVVLLSRQQLVNQLCPGLICRGRPLHPERGDAGTPRLAGDSAVAINLLPFAQPDPFQVERTLHVRGDFPVA